MSAIRSSTWLARAGLWRALHLPDLTTMNYGETHTTLGEKIITVIGFLLLSTVVAAVMVATHLVGIA